jgi:hypothetical protein
MDNKDSNGPLPTVSKSHVLQQESLLALRTIVPPDQFILRDERIDDFGVDACLEVILDACATNMRAQCQIKARSQTVEDSQHRVSVAIETANLNYLLNGSCPIYFLYRPEYRETRYAFARDEWSRIAESTPHWRQQETITVRFEKTLQLHDFAPIRERIVEEARLHRKLQEDAARLSGVSCADIHIDANTKSVTNSQEVEQMIVVHGMAMVADGRAHEIISKAHLLRTAALQEVPRIALVLGFAHYAVMDYAEAELRLAKLRADEPTRLSPEDACFARYLANAIEYGTGRMAWSEFAVASAEWRGTAPAPTQLLYDLTDLWEAYREALRTLDPKKYEPSEKKLRSACQAALQSENSAVHDSAEVTLLLIDGLDITQKSIEIIVFAGEPMFPWAERFPSISRQEAMKRALLQWAGWRKRISEVAQRCIRRGDSRTACDALILECGGTLHWEKFLALIRETRSLPPEPVSARVGDNIKVIRDFAKRTGNLELELRSQLLEAELADMEDHDRARDIAESVRRRAALLRYETLERSAERILAGEDQFSGRLDEVRAVRDLGPGEMLLKFGDRALEEMVRDLCATHGLAAPYERTARASLVAQLHAAIVRRDWCKHLELCDIEDILSIEPPGRASDLHALCKKREFRSSVSNADPETIVKAFKAAYCATCTARVPMT